MQDVILASDHRGYALKIKIKELLREMKYFCIDMGVDSAANPNDGDLIPPIIKVVKEGAECVKSAKHFCGIFICGSGVAMTIAANRFKGIRAASCHTVDEVREGRQHNDINVLCLGGDTIDFETAKKLVNVFLNTKPLDVVRYKRRQECFDTMA